MKMLKVDNGYVAVNQIISLAVFKDDSGVIMVGIPKFDSQSISDGRTLEDVRWEIEGEDEVCRWKINGYQSYHSYETECDQLFVLQDKKEKLPYLYCPFCGGRIEVAE